MAVDMAREMEHKFGQCAQFSNDYAKLSCTSRQLQPLARAFIRNMNRVRGIGMLPLNLTTIAIINESARVEALVNKGIPLHDPRIIYNHPSFDSALFSEVNEERKRLIDEWMKSWGNTLDARVMATGIQGMNVIIESNEEEAWDAVQAIMAAMLIGFWKAFESLAHGTWIAAGNTRPI